MPEQPNERLHRNRQYSVPTLGDGGPLNCFSRSDILNGKTPVKFGSGQHPNILSEEEVPADAAPPEQPTPNLWPKLWPQAGRLLTVPKVVILSDFIAWPEFWESCVFDFPRDVIGLLFTANRLSTYYYLDQWNTSSDWKNQDPGLSQSNLEYRYSQIVSTVQNPYYSQHKTLWDTFRRAKEILEAQDDPVYVMLPNWIPQTDYNITTLNHWTAWQNDNIYWPGFGEAQTDVIHGHSNCDIYSEGGTRGRTHPDLNSGYWRSDCDNPPTVPMLACPTPYFGTNVLHLWFGHFCVNWGGPTLNFFETYPLSPAGTQIGSNILSTYFGTPFDAGTDGKRIIWRDAGLNYGYTAGYKQFLDSNYKAQIEGAFNIYKENFWKYRNFGVRFIPWTDSWNLSWQFEQLLSDQKWCAAGQFYDGYSFSEWQQLISNEDTYSVDYSAETNGVKFSNTITRTPDSPTIRQAMQDGQNLLAPRVSAYYADPTTGITDGTRLFVQEMLSRYSMYDYNIDYEDNASRLYGVDELVEYINDYFGKNP